MELELRHVLSKKIDESGNIIHWFEMSKRPNGMFSMNFTFLLSDKTKGQVTVTAKSLTRKEKQDFKKSGRETHGLFSVNIPQGDAKVEKIFFTARHSVLQMDFKPTELPVSEAFQDIVEEDRIARLKLGIE